MAFAVKSKSYGNEDQRWIGNGGRPGLTPLGIVLDRSLFELADGRIPSGTELGKVTATGLYGPYSGSGNRTEEQVTFLEGGSGLTSWTATFGGQTTTSLDDDVTPEQLVAALHALSNVEDGSFVVVSGTSITAGITIAADPDGPLANTDLGTITTTPTGGTGTVGVTVNTAGGAEGSSDGRQVLAGYLFASVAYDEDEADTADLIGALFWDGVVIETFLPGGATDAAGKADVAGHITYLTDVVGDES